MFERPTVLYPTLVLGWIEGPIRWESIDGSEHYQDPPMEGEVTRLRNVKPQMIDGKMFCVTHLQKKAKFFSLKYDPFIFHWGKFWHLQEQRPDGTWIPGSESGVYVRSPGWRWNLPDQNSKGTPWIFSKGYVGGHLD